MTPQQKENEARRMAVYAGMVKSMDQNIGKLVSHLKQIGEFDNTILVFLSDNGAEANDIHDLVPRDWVAANFNNSLDNLGRPGSYIGYGPGWGQVSATPFRLYKGFPSEGAQGLPRSSFIPSSPGVARRIRNSPVCWISLPLSCRSPASTGQPGSTLAVKFTSWKEPRSGPT